MSGLQRRPNESFEAFMRRTKKQWQSSGKILQVKKVQFLQSHKSKNMRRRSAIRRAQIASKIEYLKKVGKMPESEFERS